MKRIAEKNSHQTTFDNELSKEYVNEVKKSSDARYMHFFGTLKKLNIKGRYLDIGSGPGLLAQKIAMQHPDVEITGIDNSPVMLDIARKEMPENLKPRIKFFPGNACDINSLKDLGKFDLIYSTFTLHHFENAGLAIKNLMSLLNEGGYLCIYDLKRVFWLYFIQSDNGFFKSIRASYRPREISKLLDETGITDYKIKTIFPYFMQSVLIKKN